MHSAHSLGHTHGSFIITAVFSLGFSLLLHGANPQEVKPGWMARMIRDSLIKDFLLTTIVILVMQMLHALYERNQIAVENETLRAENISTHYQALKSQMDPHFMFNSLNTLQSLIDTDTAKAHDYVQELSQVLRATLQNKEVVTLDNELLYDVVSHRYFQRLLRIQAPLRQEEDRERFRPQRVGHPQQDDGDRGLRRGV